MSFDPEKVQRYRHEESAYGEACMAEHSSGEYVTHSDYAKLKELLQEKSYTTDQLVEQVQAGVADYNDELKKRRKLEEEISRLQEERK